MKKLYLDIWIVILIVCAVGKVDAQCTCASVPGWRKYEPLKALRTSDVVFTGELIQIQQGSAVNEEKVKFKIESVWKIDVGETFILTTYKRSCSGFSGRVGKKSAFLKTYGNEPTEIFSSFYAVPKKAR